MDGAPVEVCEDAGVHAKLPQSPLEMEVLVNVCLRESSVMCTPTKLVVKMA